MPGKVENDREIVRRDMESLYLGNLKTVEFDLQLPAKGACGSDISWESGEERFLDSEGKVARPLYGMGNREVTLTGTFSYGEARMTKDYRVTVLEQENPYADAEHHSVEVAGWEGTQTVNCCEKAEVRILPGNEFYDTQERMRRYLLSVEEDEMLYHFRKASGLDTRGAQSPRGWDSEECKLKGHTTGHYLSALALCYHATGDGRIREKACYMVRELGKCQEAFSHMEGVGDGFLSGYLPEQFDQLECYTPYPKIWAPYYTLHKILAGLLDCRIYIESEEALEIAERLGMWTWRRLRRLPRRQLTKMWSMYIAGEFGGMNVVMAQLAEMTGREEFLQCARLFDNEKLFEPLSKGLDMLSGMHANQHIPQILGAVEIYKATGEKRYLDMAKVFWTTVTQNRSYAPGGVGETEMFQGFRQIGELLTANTQETCASYNMLKLTRELYQLEPGAGYMDYYERTLLNHILATPEAGCGGESTYFFPLGPGMRREFLRENSCCHGTGMESHFRYREGIYYQSGNDIYINLYIPSELRDAERDLSIRIERISQREQSYRIRVRGCAMQSLYLRKPDWAGDPQILEDGEPVRHKTKRQGYLVIDGSFAGERCFEVRWKPRFSFMRTPDMPERAAVRYGPYVLAALSDREEFIRVPLNEKNLAEEMVWEEDGTDAVHFRYGGWKWIPLYEIGDAPYHVYVICDKIGERQA